jgi:adenosine deaminase
MFESYTSDLHCHLNGSFSLEFLKRMAIKHQCEAIYEELVFLRDNYLKQTAMQPAFGYGAELIEMVWKQFGLIHQIIQDLSDITEGTIDVITHSAASYLEIRTTPKAIGAGPRDQYIDAFEAGLLAANQNQGLNKCSVGLLSLDRTLHGLDDAVYFIDRIKSSPSSVLVGLDISGNPACKRTLTGVVLGKVINLALQSGVGIAIHLAESDSELERQDTDVVLDTVEAWFKSHKLSLQGRMRLGHCIFLTEMQQARIRDLNLPIEVCPTCHSKLNWHLEREPHPVSRVYGDLSEPLVGGTDDEMIFGASADMEFAHLLRFFTNAKNLDSQAIKRHQATFRFRAPK